MRPTIPLLLLFATALPVIAEDLVCGTKAEVIQRDETRARWSEARQLAQMAKGPVAPNLSTRDNVVILRADEYNSPFRNPIDLEGKSVTFTPRGSDGYAAATRALAYESAVGTPQTLTLGGGSFARAVYTLTKFELPFFGTNVKTLYIASNNAIWLEEPKANGLDQYGDLELVAQRQPVIAPLLTTVASQAGPSSVFVNETADAVTVTWVGDDAARRYDVQATLFRDGTIRFSYKQVANVRAGGVLLTSGTEEWRNARTQLGRGTDPTGEAATPSLDLESATINRIAGLDLLEVQLTLAEPLDRSKIETAVTFIVTLAPQESLYYVVRKDGADEYTVPVWGAMTRSTAASFDGKTITMHFLQDHLATAGSKTVRAYSLKGTSGTTTDSVTFTADIDTPAAMVRTDLSRASEETISGRPVAEAFALSPISVNAAWDQIKTAYRLNDADWDGVAIYQNFLTDIVYYASAYSTVGNPGASGISTQSRIGLQLPRSPAVMHMNMVGFSPNRDERAASHVVMHEFGHHWLYFLKFRDGETNSSMLNPGGGHPAQYVDTRAAFPVYGEDDSSVMGGGTFRTNPDGSFRTTAYASYGYSWLDLYLMGLAAPSEVQPWWYLAKSSPQLGDAYYPPQNRNYRGERKDVTIDQVVAAMGERKPAYPETQREFRVLFVMLADPSREVLPSELEKMATYRRLLENNFRTATGQRAQVSTAFAAPSVPTQTGPRRRAITK